MFYATNFRLVFSMQAHGFKYSRELLIKNKCLHLIEYWFFCEVSADNSNSDQSEKIEQKWSAWFLSCTFILLARPFVHNIFSIGDKLHTHCRAVRLTMQAKYYYINSFSCNCKIVDVCNHLITVMLELMNFSIFRTMCSKTCLFSWRSKTFGWT